MLKWHGCSPHKLALQARPSPPSSRARGTSQSGESSTRLLGRTFEGLPPTPVPGPARPARYSLAYLFSEHPDPVSRCQQRPDTLWTVKAPRRASPRSGDGRAHPSPAARACRPRAPNRRPPNGLRARRGRDQRPLLLPACLKRHEPMIPRGGGGADAAHAVSQLLPQRRRAYQVAHRREATTSVPSPDGIPNSSKTSRSATTPPRTTCANTAMEAVRGEGSGRGGACVHCTPCTGMRSAAARPLSAGGEPSECRLPLGAAAGRSVRELPPAVGARCPGAVAPRVLVLKRLRWEVYPCTCCPVARGLPCVQRVYASELGALWSFRHYGLSKLGP